MSNKVLLTASTYSHIAHFHLPYLKEFQSRGWTTHIACADAPTEAPCADMCFDLPFRKKMFSPQNFLAALRLRRIIRREGYTLITTHTSLAAFFTRLAVLGLRHRPNIVNVSHGYLFDSDTAPLKRALLLGAERLTAPVTDLVLTMNDCDYEIAQKNRLGKRVAFIDGIGVNFSALQRPDRQARTFLRQKHKIPENATVLIYAAEFSARKSQSVLIRAMAELPDRVFLVLPGKGDLLARCQEEARALGVAERVIFPGYVEMTDWYATADLALSASRSEGLPFNIMEAMFAGLPVIASAVKGHTDLISDGENGLLYPYGDSHACAAAVLRLLAEPTFAAGLAEHGKSSVTPYDLAEILPAVMTYYESVCPVPAGAAR